MLTQLKKRNIAELLDKAIYLYRENFQTLVGIALIALGPLLVLKLLSRLVFKDVAYLEAAYYYLIIAQVILQTLTSVTLTIAMAQAYLREPISISEAYKRGWKRFGATWAAFFLLGLAMIIPIALLLCSGSLILSMDNLDTPIATTILLLSLTLFTRTRFSMITPATTLELKNGSQAISRSWQLTTGYFWHSLGISTIAVLLIYMIRALPGLFIMLIPGWQYSLFGNIIEIVTELALLLVAHPLNVCVTTLLYYDLRIRKEDYDLELRIAQALKELSKGTESQKEPSPVPLAQ